MAKLLAARVAWANADNVRVQIHGGNGSRLNFRSRASSATHAHSQHFRGRGEIQAQVIARRLA
jgi:(2S)-methylsuccinyl-CoA dehydrogenase